jgi:hypothetical protein
LSSWSVQQDSISIDSDAATFGYHINGNVEEAGFLKYDITALAYAVRGIRSAAVIGVGGGRDILTAKLFGEPKVVGVEINPILVRLLPKQRGFADSYGVAGMSGVTVQTDEARSWFARSADQFDSIQIGLG